MASKVRRARAKDQKNKKEELEMDQLIIVRAKASFFT